ncbi:MAG: ribosome recycling factor [Hyphomicrobium denitrificans]|uniref:Ribosome-recycling factor n=1 Tax=Hyphomicrobium denitrificans (strain ATCC 51888 / DSM 1869 / NCIMB 11706 / TK 0415) TaxID=582899 RepID=D8JZB4_HYPDA|nr:ribosome recycling factor [Hyphomicrobium denitrificans]ADJ23716.1 ribosome recycling factor [Hyphomicrobium denitrificans ATCC 51888]MBN9291774.1 ribosome recycling factor [Hyphomicrobium denitrificans]
MSLATHDINEVEKRMRASLDALKREFSGLRTGRASANLLDPVQVMVYGSRMPLNQVATVSVPEPRMISVQVWDRSNVTAVDKGIREANLGLNPIMDGQILRLPIPSLTADRRQELVKLAHKYAEQSKVAVRNVRREAMDLLKKLEKDGKMSQDDHRGHSEKVQELTDRIIKEVDSTLVTKEAEIQKV